MVSTRDFRALARSSPWRFASAHFTRRRDGDEVEAWLERPGGLTVRDAHGTHRWVNNRQADIPGEVVRAWGRLPDRYTDDELVSAYLEAPVRWARDVEPVWRPDGLVAVRPRTPGLEFDDPMYDNYEWVAMLDPAELTTAVDLTDVRETTHHGRLGWAARAVPVEGYAPRCGCCPLLWSEISDRDEAEGGGPEPVPGTVWPDAYDVVLDHATGIVVSLEPVGEAVRTALGFDVEIHSAG